MKRHFNFRRITALLFLTVAVLLLSITAACGETDFESYLNEHYLSGGWRAECVTQCSDAGAAVLCKDEQRLLIMMKNGQVFENSGAAEWPDTSVYLDTETCLFLTISSDRETTFYRFDYDEERWLLEDIRHIESVYWENQNGQTSLRETVLYITDGELQVSVLYEDENENILWQKDRPPVPNILTKDERDLAQWGLSESVVFCTGYVDMDFGLSYDSVRRRLFDTLKAGTFFQMYTYADGLIEDETLQFIADRPDGSRVLLCGSWEKNAGWTFVESTPLPAGTTIGVENFTENLLIAGLYGGPSVQQYADGTWGVACVVTYDSLYFMGQNWISEAGEPFRSEAVCYGSHPWSNITMIDWNNLPATCADAWAKMDTSRWATPNNSNPEDRLHLRARPDKGSESLGKYYNGTPVEVLEKGKEWTRVRVGQTTGYMMTDYLAFGSEMKKVTPYYSSKTPALLLTNVTVQQNETQSTTIQIPRGEMAGYAVIGLTSKEWIVWEQNTNSFGRIRDSELWDGNG